jgi:hypothetical protein
MLIVLVPALVSAVVLLGVVLSVEKWRPQRDMSFPPEALQLVVQSAVSRL